MLRDRNDTSTGLARAILDRDTPGKRGKPVRMIITREVKDVLMGWLREILTQEVILLQNRRN
jgi:hypothetical protein